MPRCPFCKRDPYHYENYVAVAITCCEPMIYLHKGEKKAKQALEFMRSHSPRKKARARRILAEYD